MPGLRAYLKKLGPGLLFASSSIGTSHLVLSTRAGAHHGMIYFWIIAFCLLMKYPFYEYGARYAAATGKDLIHAYRSQGKWAVGLFGSIILLNMFTVTAAIAGVTAGILGIILGTGPEHMPLLVAICIFGSAALLIFGGFRLLNATVRIISVLLIVSVAVCFFALLFHGPLYHAPEIDPSSLVEGSALVLLVSLVGWMPSGMEASVFYSLWVVKSQGTESTGRSEKDILLDFNSGYIFTALMALAFLLIGAYTVYGSGTQLTGNSVQFSKALINIFANALGPWSKWVFALAALGTIYGTLIVVIDVFARAFITSSDYVFGSRHSSSETIHRWTLFFIAIGAFLIFMFLSRSMIEMLELATIVGFLCAPLIAFLNMKVILDVEKSGQTRLPVWIKALSYPGLAFLTLFALYYIIQTLAGPV